MTRPITPEEHERYLKELRQAKAEDEALGGNYPPEEDEVIDPNADVVAIFLRKKTGKE